MNLKLPPALRHSRFTLLLGGMFVSSAGSRMQFWALLWHVSILSDDPIALGLVGMARIIPVIIFSLISGVVADRVNRRQIIFVTQTIQIGVASALGYLTITNTAELWHLYALTAVQAIAFAFELPARQALTPNLVPAEDLPNAFSLQSIAFTIGSISGPALNGIILASLGLHYSYFINAVSFLALFFAIIAIGEVKQDLDESGKKGDGIEAIKEGIIFIRNQPIILSSMLLDFVATFFSSANALLPLYAQDILKVGEVGYGWLTAAQSIGAAITAVIMSQIQVIRKQGKILLGMVVLFGLATIGFGFSRSLLPAMLSLMLMGATDTVSMIIRNTIRQLMTPDRLRGRMTSINQIFFMGGPQLGELEAGTVAQFFGVPFAILSGGVGCVIGVALIARTWPALWNYEGDEYETIPG